MAVYGRSYKGYAGELTPEWSRFQILTRYGLRDLFRSRFFLAVFCLCFVAPLVASIRIYFAHNLEAIGIFQLSQGMIEELLAIRPEFFRNWIIIPQTALAFVLTLLAGPALVSPDMRNNALPLILARPFSRSEYVIGKLVVLLLVNSAITWVPALLLFGFQAYLAGGGWLGDFYWVGISLLVASWVWILTVSLTALAISAWVKWKPLAALLFLALPLSLQAFGGVVNLAFRTHWGGLVQFTDLLWVLWAGLFRLELAPPAIPTLGVWAMFILAGAMALFLLSRKVTAYEVERS